MSENNLYYIYIDTRINGAIDQLLSYFQADVFNHHDCICIYFKYYKKISKYIEFKLKSFQINYKFIQKNSDLNFENNKVVFYLFNAQSNCKITAFRHLTHIFVTHGESHKLASIKPIIRIYDFVVTSGQVGIDRFLKAGIFNQFDIKENNKVIPLGDTFIGQNDFYNDTSSKNLLYAPTWEGGIPSENYSSISKTTAKALLDIMYANNLENIYIQPHPNLGHRDKKYLEKILFMVKFLRKNDIKVNIVKSKFNIKEYWMFRKCTLISRAQFPSTGVAAAMVDISAMEMQLISKNIPTGVLYSLSCLNELYIPKRVAYLYNSELAVNSYNFKKFSFLDRKKEISHHKDYLLGYFEQHLISKTFRQRVYWLCHFTTQKKIDLLEKNSKEF